MDHKFTNINTLKCFSINIIITQSMSNSKKIYPELLALNITAPPPPPYPHDTHLITLR